MRPLLALGGLLAASVLAVPLTSAREAPAPLTDAAALLTGAWHQTGPLAIEGLDGAAANLALRLRADGRFTLSGTVSARVGDHGVLVPLESGGTWAAGAVADGRIAVTFVAASRLRLPDGTALDDAGARAATWELRPDGSLADPETGAVLTRL